ncbi:MAG: hypothetical protein AB9866_20040 [Syntrophobacteraceae bacterium]
MNGSGLFLPNCSGRSIAKWTLLDAGERSRELLRLIVISCTHKLFLEHLDFSFNTLRGSGSGPLRVVHRRVIHHGGSVLDRGEQVAGGLCLGPGGRLERLSEPVANLLLEGPVLRNPSAKARLRRNFLLAYGENFSMHDGDDDFDFSDPLLRSRRFHSLFSVFAPLTDPAAFLDRLFFLGARYKRHRALHTLDRICLLLRKFFGVELLHWLDKPGTGLVEWDSLPVCLHKPLLPVFDAVRHSLDAFTKEKNPFDLPGVIILDRPDNYCQDALLPASLELFDELFPNMQFLVTLPKARRRDVPEKLRQRELPLPQPREEKRQIQSRSKSVDVLLIDVDGRLPNLALMKLSRYFKQQGRRVTLLKGLSSMPSACEVYASCIFSSPLSLKRVKTLQDSYGGSLRLGGSGVDPRGRLPSEIDNLPPDYELYPELGDRALGRLTRGCPLHCPFCIVPMKEGAPRRVADLQFLMDKGRRNKLILLDDNLLSLPEAELLLEEMVEADVMVNFTQTLDLRFVDHAKAGLLRRIKCFNTRFTRPNYYFSLNDDSNLAFVKEKYDLFGFTARDDVEFVCMYGFNTTLAGDVARFRFLRSLPGAYVFTQRYRPVPGGPLPDTTRFFEGDPDRLIDELISIVFTQNMKSMETYYRWVSREYAATFGRLHRPLVDTIFRYNHRQTKGRYIATLAGLNR